jgi:integrase
VKRAASLREFEAAHGVAAPGDPSAAWSPTERSTCGTTGFPQFPHVTRAIWPPSVDPVTVADRPFYGVLAREGLRVSEALGLTWGDIDFEHGMVILEENKTDDPRSWVLDPGVLEALRRWKRRFARTTFANTRVFLRPDGGAVDRFWVAERLRKHLKVAGVTRPQIFERSDTRMPLRAHDLRATFVTVSLALGKTEAWVTDRTGHRSSEMIYEYKRQVRSHAEANLGALTPLHEAIPEIAAATP